MAKYLALNARSQTLTLFGLVTLLLLMAVSSAAATTASFTHFSAGIGSGSSPENIATGPDQNVWFTERGVGRIARISPSGEVKEFLASGRSELGGLAVGPDGTVWFTERVSRTIGKLNPATGAVAHLPIGSSADTQPENLTFGPDGNLWITNFSVVDDRIIRMTPSGSTTEFPLPFGSRPSDITSGPDGALWFLEIGTDKIGRITPDGAITEFGGIDADSGLTSIVTGVGGDLWFTEYTGQKIGRISTDGTITEFSDGLERTAAPAGISRGPDGNIWFTDLNDRIGQITPSGAITEFYDGVSFDSSPTELITGSDGNLWYTEPNADRIGRLSVGPDKEAKIETVATESTDTSSSSNTSSVTELPGTTSERVIKDLQDTAKPVATLSRPRCVRGKSKKASRIFAKCKKTERRRLITASRYQTLRGVVSDAPYSAGVKNGTVFVRLLSKKKGLCRALKAGRLTKPMRCSKARAIWSKAKIASEIGPNGGSAKWSLKTRGLKKGMKLAGLVYAVDSAGNGNKLQAKPFTLRLKH